MGTRRTNRESHRRATVGKCPRCGKNVTEQRYSFRCSAWRNSQSQPACGFAIRKQIARKRISARTARKLLVAGQTSVLVGFESKAGEAFAARLVLDAGDVRLEFI